MHEIRRYTKTPSERNKNGPDETKRFFWAIGSPHSVKETIFEHCVEKL